MSRLMERIRHAFAVDPPGPQEPTAEQQEAVDWFCRQVAKRHLTTPGLIAMELGRPLNYLASQTMHFFSPGVWSLVGPHTHRRYEQFAAFLERRGSVEYLAGRIEHFEQEYERLERRARGEANGQADDKRPTGGGDLQG